VMLYGPALYKDNFITADKKNINLSVKIKSNFPEDGNTTITVSSSKAAFFPFALRVPSWCQSFIAKVGGKEYKGTANQYVVIKRVWNPGDKIKISFNIPIQILSGGKSYAGQIAFQRGPQVLAFDSSLNTELLKRYQFESNQKLFVENAGNITKTDLLPKQWIGDQAYSVTITGSEKNGVKQQITLVPFADASQTGGAIKVWMPLIVTGKSKESN